MGAEEPRKGLAKPAHVRIGRADVRTERRKGVQRDDRLVEYHLDAVAVAAPVRPSAVTPNRAEAFGTSGDTTSGTHTRGDLKLEGARQESVGVQPDADADGLT